MRDLKNGPDGFVALLAVVGGGFGVFHLVGEFEEGVFDVVEAVGWGLAVLGGADGWHGAGWCDINMFWALWKGTDVNAQRYRYARW